MKGDNNKDVEVIESQLEIFFKNTDFWEREITQLHTDWVNDHSRETKQRLLEANARYNRLAREGKEYVESIQWDYPELFTENITEFKMREGWYDPYLQDLKK